MTTYLYDISLENLLMHIRTYAENVVATDHDGKPVVRAGSHFVNEI